MNRPSPYTGYLGNYNDDAPTMALSPPKLAGPPLDWNASPPMPTLIGRKGEIVFGFGFPEYYRDGEVWRETISNEIWDGVKQ